MNPRARPSGYRFLEASSSELYLSHAMAVGSIKRIAVDVSMIPTEKMSTDATFRIIEKNFAHRISLMKITLPSAEIFRAIWLLDTDPDGLPLIQAIR